MAYIPRVGILIGHHAFDISILYSRREVNHLFILILTIFFRPGVGIWQPRSQGLFPGLGAGKGPGNEVGYLDNFF